MLFNKRCSTSRRVTISTQNNTILSASTIKNKTKKNGGIKADIPYGHTLNQMIVALNMKQY